MDVRNTKPYNICNPHRYKESLSCFGKKVLDNLIRKWTSDRNRIHNQHFPPQSRMLPPDPSAADWHRRKKVLTPCHKIILLCSDLPRSVKDTMVSYLKDYLPTTLHKSKKEGSSYEKKKLKQFMSEQPRIPHLVLPPNTFINNENNVEEPFDFNEKNQLPEVHTTKELFKTVHEFQESNNIEKNSSVPNKTTDKTNSNFSHRNEDVNISTYDMINSVIDNNEAMTKTDYFYNKMVNNEDFNKLDNAKNDCNELESKMGLAINWDNMFDTELLPDTNAKLIIKQNAIAAKPDSTIVIPEYDNQVQNKEKSSTKMHKNSIKTKRKVQAKVTDIIPKKVKKACEKEKSKNTFRKQKYTKTVTNWLDGVSANNPVEDGVIDENDRAVDKPNLVIDKSEVFNNKKVVQAQLANKEGKMKFAKPKEKIETKVEVDNLSKPKEKKVKPKFTAPIKSQLPIKEVNYELVTVDDDSLGKFAGSLCQIENKDVVVVLLYSNGFSQLNQQHTEDSCEPEGFFAYTEEKFYYFKSFHQSFKEVVGQLFEKNRIICYEGKNILIYLKSKYDLEFNDLCAIDTKIGAYLLDPDKPPENFSDLQKLLSYTPQYTVATECAQQKAAWYCTLLEECAVKLTTALKEDGLWHVFADIEMKLLPIIAEMEYRGVAVDMVKLKSMEDVLLAKMKEVEQACYKAAGRSFQINSAVQIRAIIYDELQLDTKCNVKIRETLCQGLKSTSETMLRSLVSEHPLPRLILEYRHLHKAHATFVAGIAQQVRDGVVRPTWDQTAAATGRIASNNPNLQAIPKAPFSLNLFPDETNPDSVQLSFRSVYVARAGRVLVAADFQHVECRVLAHCAADDDLKHALRAGDLFRALAAQWLQKGEDAVSAEERERTKRLVYASLYGAGRRKLADILGLPYDQALSIIASFDRRFPSLKSFARSVVSGCAGGQAARSAAGRARRLPRLASARPAERAHAERQAVNLVVQGTAADLCKTAMAAARRRLREQSAGARLLLQIHDELVWEVRHQHLHTAAAIIKEVMESCGPQCGVHTTLPVAVSVGRTWGDMEPYSPPTTQ